MFKNFKKSFTLLEVIFSISILVLTILGVFALVNLTLGFAPIAQHRLIAFYLAQEAIEIIRNIRDTNWINNLNWTNNLNITDSYYLDYQSQKFPDDPPCNHNFLYLDTTPPFNYYNCRGQGLKTRFQRKVILSEPATSECPLGECIRVEVEVEWQEKGKTHKVKAMENLYNWRQ